jgi:hypothetical protein
VAFGFHQCAADNLAMMGKSLDIDPLWIAGSQVNLHQCLGLYQVRGTSYEANMQARSSQTLPVRGNRMPLLVPTNHERLVILRMVTAMTVIV